MNRICFEHDDLTDELPAPGWYAGAIKSARFRHSSKGNRMLQVVHQLEGVSAASAHVTDYFVLEGTSERGVITARRRLVNLYRACGLDPREGAEICPGDLCRARLGIRVEHDEWGSQRRLRSVAYRSADSEGSP
jgi:hypothetical protein